MASLRYPSGRESPAELIRSAEAIVLEAVDAVQAANFTVREAAAFYNEAKSQELDDAVRGRPARGVSAECRGRMARAVLDLLDALCDEDVVKAAAAGAHPVDRVLFDMLRGSSEIVSEFQRRRARLADPAGRISRELFERESQVVY